jgi:hypothetical protein
MAFKIWNVDTAQPVGEPIRGFRAIRRALLDCIALEARSGEHHALVLA